MFEVFDTKTGVTRRFVRWEHQAKTTLQYFPSYDYVPAQSGFYVVDQLDSVKGGCYGWKETARNIADMANMASDLNTYSVVEWTKPD